MDITGYSSGGRKTSTAAYHLHRMVRKDVTITELVCSDFHGLFYTPEFTCADHLHLCLVGRRLDRISGHSRDI